MANSEHVNLLLRYRGMQRVEAWNQWRDENPAITPDLSNAELSQLDFMQGNLNGANLSHTDLSWADLLGTSFVGANLSGANLHGIDARDGNFADADLTGSDLAGACLINANFQGADLTAAYVYGVSAWNIKLEGAKQSSLIITLPDEPAITVDNLEVAQFIYLLLKNEKIRHVLDTLTSRAVLILGRFTNKRKTILHAIRDELQNRGYLPIIFDFDGPQNRTLTETVTTLARLSYFIIADISSPRSIPQELYAIVPHLVSVPVQPIIEATQTEWGMWESLKAYPWVLDVHTYKEWDDLQTSFDSKVLTPARRKAEELRNRRVS
jgi:hypothetical protein